MQVVGSPLARSGLAAWVEDLRVRSGASYSHLYYWAKDTRCPCSEASPPRGPVTFHAPGGNCPLFENGAQPDLALMTADKGGNVGMCARSRLADGGTVALQLGLPEPVSPGGSRDDLATELVPVVMWAGEALGREAAEDRLAEVERRSRMDLLGALRAHEQERERLAYEVHDRIAQTLASVFQQLQALEGLARSSPEIRQIAVRSSMLTREAIREARSIMNDLHPPVLDELGLAPLVEEELRRLHEDTGCHTRSELAIKVRPSRDIEMVCYRILLEALVNVRRHSQANEVVVSLSCTSEGVDLSVQDDGVGFDVAAALARKRVGGLMSLTRRAELAGGTCHLESTLGKGTVVKVWIPWLENSQGE